MITTYLLAGRSVQLRSSIKNLSTHLLLCVFLLFGSANNNQCQEQPDTLVQRLINEISDSSYANSILRLQNFSTRYELSDSIGPVGQWIYEQFLRMGYTDVEFDSFSWNPLGIDSSIVSRNIIATKPGSSGSDSLVVLGAHYDSINDMLSEEDSNAPAPGANDNATGIAGILEIARLIEPYSFEKSIVFACFAGEERGMGGSSHFAVDLHEQGMPIRLSIVLDMIGYQEPFVFDIIIDANVDYINESLRIAELAWTYDLWLSPRLTFEYYASDHWPLGTWAPSLLITENAQYPFIHSEWDMLDSLDVPFAVEITKLALASVVDFAEYETVKIETSDPERKMDIPKAFFLSQNYPNPFNPSTSISFNVPGTTDQRVSLIVYDVRGKRTKTLIDSSFEPGTHMVSWNGRDDDGEPVPSGIYLYVLRAGDQTLTRKMTALK